MLERERKFVLKEMPSNCDSFIEIEQGYIMQDSGKILRIRIIEGTESFICFKSYNNITDRQEFEYSIPIEDAKELMLNHTYIVLKKKRYSFFYNDRDTKHTVIVDIDVYEDGTKTVELEYVHLLKEIPEFCGEEVTGKKEWSNIEIAKRIKFGV